jgi:hypothetical protein
VRSNLSRARRFQHRRISDAVIHALEPRQLFSSFTAVNLPEGVHNTYLLKNGKLLAQNWDTQNFFYLTPDSSGNYANLTQTQAALSINPRLYYGATVLDDGRLLVSGGEYDSGNDHIEIYDPNLNTWTAISKPSFLNDNITDNSIQLLPNGNVLMGTGLYGELGIYNPTTNSWTQAASFPTNWLNEVSMAILPDGSVFALGTGGGADQGYRYVPSLNQWISAGSSPVPLNTGEGGPITELPDGKLFMTGDDQNGVMNSAIYTPPTTLTGTGSWQTGPVIPVTAVGAEADMPLATLPNGEVLIPAQNGSAGNDVEFFTYNESTNSVTQLTNVPSTLQNSTWFYLTMLELPSGQTWITNGGGTAFLFNPDGTAPAASMPTVSSVSHNSDGSYTITGTQLAGVSEGGVFGDDVQQFTNFPIVQLTSGSNVYYASEYNPSTTAVGPSTSTQTANFRLPLGLPAGTYSLKVIASGIASAATTITTPSVITDVAPKVATAATATPLPDGGTTVGLSTLGASANGESTLTYTWVNTAYPSGTTLASFSANGTNAAKSTVATLHQIGSYTFKVYITDADGLSATSTVTINVTATLTSIAISPDPADLTVGQSQQLVATAYDQFGAALISQPSFAWALNSGTGSISSTGLYTAPTTTGTLATVNASSGSVVGTDVVGVVNTAWTSTDIGGPSLGGYAYDAGTTSTTLTGSGSGFNGTGDQFHMDYQSVTGNATIQTTVTSLPSSGDTNAQSGIMFRDSTSDEASFVALANSTSNGIYLSYRNGSGGSVTNVTYITAPSGSFDLKLARNGANFVASYSPDGINWTQLGVIEDPALTTPAIAGLAVSSDNSALLASSSFTGTVISEPTIVAPATAVAGTITGTTASLSVLGGNATYPTGEASLTYTWVATSTPTGAVAPTYSANGTNAAKNTTVSFYKAGNYTFVVTLKDPFGQTVTSTVTVTVTSTFTSIAIAPPGADLNAATTETFAAVANDQFGIALTSQPSITWSVVSGAGSISGSTGVYSAAGSSGISVIKATSGVVSQTITVVVIPTVASPLPTVAVAATATPIANNLTSAALAVLGADDAGESVLTYTWAATTLPIGATAPSFSINGTNTAKNTIATFSKAGAYTFTVTITDAVNHSVTSTVSMVLNQSLATIAITPGSISVDQSTTQNFTAIGSDQFGNVLAVQPAVTWSVTGEGSITSAGMYSSPDLAGTGTVQATSGGISQTATVSVTGVELQYRITASDYNTSSGTLRDEVAGLVADQAGNPTIATNATPTGKPALVFSGSNSFNFTAVGPRTQNQTIFAVVKPSSSMSSLANGGSIIGGSDGSPGTAEYRLIENSAHTGLVQQVLETGVQSLGESTNTVSTSGFSIIEVVLNEDNNVSNFYNDGTIDPSSGSANNLAAGASRIGARQTGNSGTTEYFIGDIAEVDVYSDALSASDSAAIESQLAAEYLTPRTLTSIVITPGASSVNESATRTFTAVGYDQYGVALATQPNFTWSDTGVGSIGSSTGVFTAPASTGVATLKVTSGSISQTATVSVTHSIPTIAVAAAASPGTVTGLSTSLSVLGAEVAGESNLIYTWTATTLPGGAAQPSFSANGTNAAKNTVATFSSAGTYVLTAVAADDQGAGTASSSVTITVNPTLTSITIAPPSANLHENVALTFAPTGYDQFGDPIAIPPTFTWSLLSGIGSINSVSGVYTSPNTAGSATIEATSGSINGTASITVSNAVPTVATAAAATPNPAIGTTTALSVLGSDDGGESNLTYTWTAVAMPSGATAPTYSINGTNGAKNTTATFSRAGAYTFTVTIADGQGNSVTSSVSISVTQTLKSIVLTPSTGSLDESATEPFTAVGYDQFGAMLASQPSFTWSVTGGGTINSSSGLFTAPATTATVTVKASSGSVNQTATVTVAAPALVYKITASDYNTSSGVLKDEVAGLTASATGGPIVTANDTPSGAPAITFNGSNAFVFNGTGPYSQNQTIFAVIKPSAALQTQANGGAIIGGAQVTSVEYRLIENSAGTGLVQADVQTNTNNLDTGSTIVGTSGFSIVEMVLNQSSNLTTFYDNGTADPTTGPANNITTGASRIGARQADGSATSEYFIGDIAEIDIYNNALSSSASAAIESQLYAQYFTTAATRQLSSIVISPGANNLHEDAAQTFTAVGYDQYGVPLATQPAFSWSSTGVGSINSATGVYTAPAGEGNATIKVSSGSFSQTATVTVTNSAPTVATAAAAAPATVTGNTAALSVLGADDNGQSNLTYTWAATNIPSGAVTPTFSVNGTNAAQNTTATFYKIGTYTFTATISDGQGKSVTSSVTMTVNATLTTITVAPTTVSLAENTQQTFTATGYDQFANVLVSQPVFTWSESGDGAINSLTGTFTAGSSVGAATVMATSNSISGSAAVSIDSAPSAYTGTTGNDTYVINVSPTNPTIEQVFVDTPESGTPHL